MAGVNDPLVMFADRLPVGSMPELFVGVISYLDPSGDMAYCVIHSGGATLSSYVGLLELGKLKVIEYFETGGE